MSSVEHNNAFMKALADIPVVSAGSMKKLVHVSPEATLGSVMEILEREDIMSVPVVDGSGKGAGFIDMLDIIEYLVSCLKNTKSDADINEFSDMVLSTKISAVIDFSRRDMYAFISGGDDLTRVVDLFASGLVHRVATGRTTGDDSVREIPLSICSQFDVIRTLSVDLKEADSDAAFKEMGAQKIEDFVGFLSRKKPETLKKNATLLDALATFIDESVSVVGIQDMECKRLIGAFATEDMKPWKKADFESFTKPVVDYLHSKQSKNLAPVTAFLDTSLSSVIHMLHNTKAHHLWIVNENYEPLHIITLTDIMRIITNYKQESF